MFDRTVFVRSGYTTLHFDWHGGEANHSGKQAVYWSDISLPNNHAGNIEFGYQPGLLRPSVSEQRLWGYTIRCLAI